MAIFDMKNSSQHPTQTIWSLYSIILTVVITLYQRNIEVAHHFPSSKFSLSSSLDRDGENFHTDFPASSAPDIKIVGKQISTYRRLQK